MQQICFTALLTVLTVLVGQTRSTPLDDYVYAPDPHFGWTVIQTYEQPDYVLYILNFTSQKWYDGTFFRLYRHSSVRIRS